MSTVKLVCKHADVVILVISVPTGSTSSSVSFTGVGVGSVVGVAVVVSRSVVGSSPFPQLY